MGLNLDVPEKFMRRLEVQRRESHTNGITNPGTVINPGQAGARRRESRLQPEREAQPEHRRPPKPADLQPEGESAGLDAEAKSTVEAEQVAIVDEQPGPDQSLEIDALNVELEPEVDRDPKVVAVVKECHARAAAQRKTACQEGIRAQGQVQLADTALDPVRAKAQVHRRIRRPTGSGQRHEGSNNEGSKNDHGMEE